MNNRKRILYILSVMVIILIAALMTACKTEDITKRAENEEKLLKAMTEYPGNGLYDPAETVIGLDAPEPTEEELASFEPDFVVYNASKAKCENWKELGLHSDTVAMFNITSREQVILNTWYGGEMKKGMFSMMKRMAMRVSLLAPQK